MEINDYSSIGINVKKFSILYDILTSATLENSKMEALCLDIEY